MLLLITNKHLRCSCLTAFQEAGHVMMSGVARVASLKHWILTRVLAVVVKGQTGMRLMSLCLRTKLYCVLRRLFACVDCLPACVALCSQTSHTMEREKERKVVNAIAC